MMKRIILAALVSLPLMAGASQSNPALLNGLANGSAELINVAEAANIRGETITVSKTERRCWRGHCWNHKIKKSVNVPVPIPFGVIWVKH